MSGAKVALHYNLIDGDLSVSRSDEISKLKQARSESNQKMTRMIVRMNYSSLDVNRSSSITDNPEYQSPRYSDENRMMSPRRMQHQANGEGIDS
jgi:hypothetical protein